MTDLNLRVTHKYVGTYKDLDEWQRIGSFKVLRSGPVKWNERDDDEEDDYTDAGSYLYIVSVELDEGFDDEDAARALRNTYSSHGCSHEYDCCGCVSTSADAHKQYDNQWLVLVNARRNY